MNERVVTPLNEVREEEDVDEEEPECKCDTGDIALQAEIRERNEGEEGAEQGADNVECVGHGCRG